MRRFLIGLLWLPFLPLRLLYFAVSWASFSLWRRFALRPGRHYVLEWSGEVVEEEPEGRLQRILRDLVTGRGEEGVALSEVRQLRRAMELRAPTGILLRLGALDAGYAKCSELHAELARIAKTTKVYVHLKDGAGGRELLVASAGHQISAPPSVHMTAVGASSTTFFAKSLLERFGLRARVASRGRYKSAIEPFTRTGRSDEDREQSTALVQGLDELLISTLAEELEKSREEITNLIDDGPYSGHRAAERGLIDKSRREDELVKEIAAEVAPLPFRLDRGDKLSRVARVPRLRLLPSSRRELGLVMVEGTIVDRRVPHQLSQAAESEVVDDLRTALADDDLAAVVLYVDSPGGSVSASDAILAAVRRLDEKKPVVAYFADTAASGGYYIACGARRIVASPHCITGSIGVFHLLPDASRLLERLEVGVDTVKLRAHADFASPWRALTESELHLLDQEVEEIYERFLNLVVEARKRPKDEVSEAAEGRVWLGQEAHARGLVDELGGLEDALAAARKLAGHECEEVPRVVRTKRRAQNRLPIVGPPEPIELVLAALGPLPREEARLLRELWLLRASSQRPSWLYAPIVLR